MRNLLFVLFSVLVFGCEEPEIIEEIEVNRVDELVKNNCSLTLEQVYIMGAENSIPYADSPVDSCFKNGLFQYSCPIYKSYSIDDSGKSLYPLMALTKGEIWKFEMIYNYDTAYIEQGFGENYSVQRVITPSSFLNINRSNDYLINDYAVKYTFNDIYTYRGKDERVFEINQIDPEEELIYRSKLILTILTNFQGTAFFDDGYIYMYTNRCYSFTFSVTAPLTSDKVKIEIANGNYELYLWKGLTTYKIGNNLYIPRYNSYVYVGDYNMTGTITSYDVVYYKLKFKIN